METAPRWWIAPVHVAAYLVATAGWIVVLAVGLFAWMFAGGSITDPGVVAIFTIVQLVGMVALAVGGAALLPPRSWSALPATLGFVRPSAIGVALALLLGLVVGLFPSWLSDALGDWLPTPLVNQLIGDGLDGSVRMLLLTGLMVSVSAPIGEEIVFRGYLWSAFERSGAPPAVTWIATSLLFTVYHLDPSQMIGVLPIALALGWTRWRTGSVWPGMVLHFANNTLALAASAGVASDWTPPAWLALLSLTASLALCGALGEWGRGRMKSE